MRWKGARRCVRGAWIHSGEPEDESRGTVGKVRCVFCLCSMRSERLGGGDFWRERRVGGRR